MSETFVNLVVDETPHGGVSGDLPHAPLPMPTQQLENDVPFARQLFNGRFLNLLIGRRLEP